MITDSASTEEGMILKTYQDISRRIMPGMLDTTEIAQMLGSEAKLRKVLQVFLESLNTLMADMKTGLEQGDAEQVSRAAHTLKSSSAMIGAQKLSVLCRDIEAITRQGELAGIEPMLQEAGKIGLLLEQEIRRIYPEKT
ncbi:MAG: Hpt domain-containing protein [Mariprofundus sp.]